MINVCTGDPRFVNDHGEKPGFWIKVRPGCEAWRRLARALAEAGEPHPPLA